jgi:hypothetical protein
MTTKAPAKRRWKMPEIGNITNHADKVVIRQSGNITSVVPGD